MVKHVDKEWLWRRAKTIEAKILKRDGHSLAAVSIENRLSKCIVDIHIDEDVMEIDYDVYKHLRKQIIDENLQKSVEDIIFDAKLKSDAASVVEKRHTVEHTL